MATVSIKQLRIEAVIGICEHELSDAQPLLFDLEMQTDIEAAAKSDSINDALDYAAVAKRIEAIVDENSQSNLRDSDGHGKRLLEGLLVAISDALLEEFKAIASLTISVQKPKAIPNATYAAISYTASR